MRYVYHRVPQNLTGSVLQPLNTLRETLPKVYDAHVQKYQERTALLERQIPYLNCLWNDVLHFSPVDPEQIRDSLIQAGHQWTPRKWFKIDPARVGFAQDNTIIYYSRPKEKGDFTTKVEDFQAFSLEELDNISLIPIETIKYYREVITRREPPFIFVYMPHVLYRGNIDIADASILEI